MINKIYIIQERINNLNFHINHVQNVINSPDTNFIPEGKIGENLNSYLKDLINQKETLEIELESLTNQG